MEFHNNDVFCVSMFIVYWKSQFEKQEHKNSEVYWDEPNHTNQTTDQLILSQRQELNNNQFHNHSSMFDLTGVKKRVRFTSVFL